MEAAACFNVVAIRAANVSVYEVPDGNSEGHDNETPWTLIRSDTAHCHSFTKMNASSAPIPIQSEVLYKQVVAAKKIQTTYQLEQ